MQIQYEIHIPDQGSKIEAKDIPVVIRAYGSNNNKSTRRILYVPSALLDIFNQESADGLAGFSGRDEHGPWLLVRKRIKAKLVDEDMIEHLRLLPRIHQRPWDFPDPYTNEAIEVVRAQTDKNVLIMFGAVDKRPVIQKELEIRFAELQNEHQGV